MDRVREIASITNKIIDNIKKVIKGKDEIIRLTVIALLSEGHLLLEDIPGVGKTSLARALAKSVDCTFKRIQFTPDLLPSDITGFSVYDQKLQEFRFNKGPIFANIVLADEINRATPRTQSSLLEVMNETQVTVDGITYPLEKPFMVISTQNPIEYQGTFPLPEAQMDRFLMRISIGYPDTLAEKEIIYSRQSGSPLDELEPVIKASELLQMQKEVQNVKVDESLVDYIIAICNRTRNSKEIVLGVSPRGTLAFFRASQANALISARDFCIPDDIKAMAVPTLAHRIILENRNAGSSENEAFIKRILREVPVPT